jgi:hypothetical protein
MRVIVPNGTKFAKEVEEVLWRNVVATAMSVGCLRQVCRDGRGAYLKFLTNKALSIESVVSQVLYTRA